jgi:hypothetical protein
VPPRAISTSATLLSARTAEGPPAAVQPRINERVLAGYSSANSCAIMPPIETPKTWARETPAASRTAAASDAMVAIE